MTPAQEKRQRIWRHNSFSGHARMMEMQLQAMIEADSTTEKTKFFARTILDYVDSLKQSLKTRTDT